MKKPFPKHYIFVPPTWPLTCCLNPTFLMTTQLQPSTIHLSSTVPPGGTYNFSWAFIRSYFMIFTTLSTFSLPAPWVMLGNAMCCNFQCSCLATSSPQQSFCNNDIILQFPSIDIPLSRFLSSRYFCHQNISVVNNWTHLQSYLQLIHFNFKSFLMCTLNIRTLSFS